MAFGPCLLTSRIDYERAGGHAAVRQEVLDDVQLAVAYRRAGLPVRCAVGARSVSMRSYPGGLKQLTDGWTKNFASGAAAAAPGPTIGAVSWVGAHHAVAVGAALSLTAALTGHDFFLASGDPLLWVVAWAVVAWQLRAVLRQLGSFRWWTWAVFPLPLFVFDLVFARSLVHTAVRRSVRWRGRDVPLGGRASADEAT
jgi:4,4'-diaponeurosporenoate glycosyltransferase